MFEWILAVIERGGYAGIFFLMVAENIFPPIPSEVILPLAGFAAARGDLSVVAVILVAAFGAVVGCLPWYLLGRTVGIAGMKRLSARYGRVLTLSPEDVDDARVWFVRYGRATILFGRLVPAVRTLISVPAGVAHTPLSPFLLYSGIGSAVWASALVILGFVLESQYTAVAGYVNSISDGVVVVFVLVYVYRVVTFRTRPPVVPAPTEDHNPGGTA
jgi:membrane protein DedA with SNARE-associated domain